MRQTLTLILALTPTPTLTPNPNPTFDPNQARKEAEAALLRGARLPAAVAKILDENQWSWAVTGTW